MRILKELWKTLAAVGLLALIVVIIWMNRFQYEHYGQSQILVRINRFTGQECFLLGGGWNSSIAVTAPKKDEFEQYRANSSQPNDPYPGKVVRVDPATSKPYLADDPKVLDTIMYQSADNTCR